VIYGSLMSKFEDFEKKIIGATKGRKNIVLLKQFDRTS